MVVVPDLRLHPKSADDLRLHPKSADGLSVKLGFRGGKLCPPGTWDQDTLLSVGHLPFSLLCQRGNT